MLKFILQLFGEGGDGGDGGATGETGEGFSGEEMPSAIPERAKKYYEKAVRSNSSRSSQESTTEIPAEASRKSYEDMIKSDEYRDEHKAYMEKTIGDRLKKYKGMEGDFNKAKEMLGVIANKYNVDPTAEDFLSRLSQAIDADDSYYEDYAIEHDISTEDARKMVTMERKLKSMEAEREANEKQEAARQQILQLQRNAEQTKLRFPEFDLDTEMQNEKFRRLCAVNQGDTTAAYMACHWNDIMFSTARSVSQKAQVATTNAIASGSRPAENGTTQSAPSVSTPNFKGMSLNDIRAFADQQRRKGR